MRKNERLKELSDIQERATVEEKHLGEGHYYCLLIEFEEVLWRFIC